MDKDELLERYEALGKDEARAAVCPEATSGAIITQNDGLAAATSGGRATTGPEAERPGARHRSD
jgi:hypothetical protein